MKILIPMVDFGRTGGFRVLSELANSWVRSNHQVSFIAPDCSELPYFSTIAPIIFVDRKGLLVDQRSDIKSRGTIKLFSIYKALNSIADQYDIILANYSLTAFPVSFCKCSNSKKFYYIQAYEPDYFWNVGTLKSKLLGMASKLSYYLPLKTIVNAPVYFSYKNIRADAFVPPGLDLNIFKPADTSVIDYKNKETIIIGCIGRKEPEKGIKYVLKAFEQLHNQDKRFLLRVAFDNLPNDWSHERCEVIIPKNDNELASFYKSLDILIAPGTVQHGAPHYPVLEAMACAIPVATTGYYGADNSTAWIVENKSSESIVKVVIDIINNIDLTHSKSLKALQVAQQLDWEVISTKMIDYFRSKSTDANIQY